MITSKDGAAVVGVVIFCHGDMGAGILNAAEMIIGPQVSITTVCIKPGDGRDAANTMLAEAVKEVDTGRGTVVLTDLPGGTPSNLTALKISENLEMITGFNLPLLINVLMSRSKQLRPSELAKEAAEYGREHIFTGTELIKRAEL